MSFKTHTTINIDLTCFINALLCVRIVPYDSLPCREHAIVRLPARLYAKGEYIRVLVPFETSVKRKRIKSFSDNMGWLTGVPTIASPSRGCTRTERGEVLSRTGNQRLFKQIDQAACTRHSARGAMHARTRRRYARVTVGRKRRRCTDLLGRGVSFFAVATVAASVRNLC